MSQGRGLKHSESRVWVLALFFTNFEVMSKFSNLPGGPVSAPVKWGHNWFYQRLRAAVGGWGLANKLPCVATHARTHARTHSLIHTLLAACLHRVRPCAKQIVTQTWSGEWKRQIWRLSSDCTVIQIQAGIIIMCQLLQQTEIDCGGYKQKKKKKMWIQLTPALQKKD